MTTKVAIRDCRLAFADLFEAKAFAGEGDPRFSATFIVDPASPNVKVLDDAILAVARAKWADKAANILADLKGKGRVCFIHGPKTNGQGDPYTGFDGMFSMTASNKARPTIIDRDKTPLVAADGRPYSGCYANASIEIWAQDNQWGKRINATLLGVQFVRDGDAFAGGSVASPDDFEDLSAGADVDEFA